MIASTSFGAFSSGTTATPRPAAPVAATGARPGATITPAASRTLAAAPLPGAALPAGPAPRRGSLLDIQA